MTDGKSVGLVLSDEDYKRLKQYAEDRKWSMALAARVIIIDHLDKSEGIGP